MPLRDPLSFFGAENRDAAAYIVASRKKLGGTVIDEQAFEEATSDAFAERSGCGFSFGSGCSGSSDTNLFGAKKANQRDVLIAFGALVLSLGRLRRARGQKVERRRRRARRCRDDRDQ